MQDKLHAYINRNKALIENEMKRYFDQLTTASQLKESMIYSVKAGGKRIRPILLMASYETYGEDIERVLSSAVAIEMIHTYSLIHDDLPAMDNDDLRRGKPTNHRVFDEATAILAGDALLTHSFEVITSDPKLTDKEKVYIINLLAHASGPKGMVAGQILDMEAENNTITLGMLEEIHALKTGELITFSVLAGGYLGNATDTQLKHLNTFSYYLGLIFQVQDDILDVVGDPSKIGKPTGSDIENKKSTYPNLLGLEGAIDHKRRYVEKAREALHKANAADSYLMGLTEYFSQRDH